MIVRASDKAPEGLGHFMVGTMRCPECGAMLKNDYQFCNLCGHRFTGGGEVRGPRIAAPGRNPPRIVERAPVPPPRPPDRRPLPRRTLIVALLTILAMSPLTPWVGTLGGLVGIQSFGMDMLLGRYIAILAVAGMVLVLYERLVPDLRLRRFSLAGIGAGAVALTAMDMMEVYRLRITDEYLSFLGPSIGLGMYLTLAVGLLLIFASLPLRGSTSDRTAPTIAPIRPGSRGSGP